MSTPIRASPQIAHRLSLTRDAVFSPEVLQGRRSLSPRSTGASRWSALYVSGVVSRPISAPNPLLTDATFGDRTHRPPRAGRLSDPLPWCLPRDGRDAHLAQAVSEIRRGLRRLLESGWLPEHDLRRWTAQLSTDGCSDALDGLSNAELMRRLVRSRRGHGYCLAVPAGVSEVVDAGSPSCKAPVHADATEELAACPLERCGFSTGRSSAA